MTRVTASLQRIGRDWILAIRCFDEHNWQLDTRTVPVWPENIPEDEVELRRIIDTLSMSCRVLHIRHIGANPPNPWDVADAVLRQMGPL